MADRALKILVVDDEAAMREVLEMRLGQWGYEVHLAETGAEGLEIAGREAPDVVISDVALPDRSGIELVGALRALDPERPVILITAYGTINAAVEAMKLGALDFLTKPLDYDKLAVTLEAAAGEVARRTEAHELEARLAGRSSFMGLVGGSPQMLELYKTLRVLGQNDAAVLLTGESGTGKELAARSIHGLSRRVDGPFVAVNSAAIPEGLTESELFGHEKGAFTGASGRRPGFFEQAHEGTLFLDEISEMPALLQAKLLRVLEDGRVRRVGGAKERQVDVRVLAATNLDPADAIARKRLRQDLYYRLNVFAVALPPLRERAEDVPLLVQYFIGRFNAKHGAAARGAAPEVLERLAAFGWPGNVRELRNVIERAVILAREGWLERAHLPPYLRRAPEAKGVITLPAGATAAEAEKILILETLERLDHNKSRAARQLGLDVKTIRSKLKAYAGDEG
jgi:DNA-binding NtrC family response regulator